ncbi:hypothetical protein ACWEQC_10915 [Streptomyces shenzhenensis]
MGHFAAGMERAVRGRAREGIRAVLDEAAYAEGGGLSLAEATALV